MEGNYEVLFGNQVIGKVQVLRQGLYYRFICRCRISSEMVCRLRVTCGDTVENLGVVVPMDGGFGLDTRLPAKRFETGEMHFALVPQCDASRGKFIPIYPEEPFGYLTKLKTAYLTYREGQAGILLQEQQIVPDFT